MSFFKKNSTAETDPANIQDQQLATNQQAVPLPYIAGTRKIPVTWISNVGNLIALPANNGGKKGSKTSGKGSAGSKYAYNYYGSAVGAICQGTVDGIVSILSNNKLIWPPYNGVWAAGSTIKPNQLFLYNAVVWQSISTLPFTCDETNAPDGVNGSQYCSEQGIFGRGGKR